MFVNQKKDNSRNTNTKNKDTIIEKARILVEKERIQKENEKKEEEKRKVQNEHKKEQKNKIKYNIKIFYKIPKFSGETEFEYTGEKYKNKLERIYVGDKIQYFNEKHPNHLKKGVVNKWSSGGTYNEPYVKFEIIFNDPPFIYEKNNKTGQLYKTKKKIKIIQNASFKRLKKIEGFSNNFIEMNVMKQYDDYNLRKGLEEKIKNKKNSIVSFYKIILFLLNIDIDHTESTARDVQIETVTAALESLTPQQKSSLGLTVNNYKLQVILSIIDFNFLFKMDKTPFLDILKEDTASKKNAYDFFENLVQYHLKKSDFNLNNDIDYYKFIMGIKKMEKEINEMKLISYEEDLENKIKEFVKKKFIKNEVFYPKKVKIRYKNKSTIYKKEFYNNPSKLVEPTDNKVFTINKYDFFKLTQLNDYTTENIQKSKIFIIKKVPNEEGPGIIKIKLNIDLDINDLLTTNELINEMK